MAYTTPTDYPTAATVERQNAPAYQAYGILHFAFAAIPLVAGADRFFYYLTDGRKDIPPMVPGMSYEYAETIHSASTGLHLVD